MHSTGKRKKENRSQSGTKWKAKIGGESNRRKWRTSGVMLKETTSSLFNIFSFLINFLFFNFIKTY